MNLSYFIYLDFPEFPETTLSIFMVDDKLKLKKEKNLFKTQKKMNI